jgi:hypothetical protein
LPSHCPIAAILRPRNFSGSCPVTSRNPLIQKGATTATKSKRFDPKGVLHGLLSWGCRCIEEPFATVNFREFYFHDVGYPGGGEIGGRAEAKAHSHPRLRSSGSTDALRLVPDLGGLVIPTTRPLKVFHAFFFCLRAVARSSRRASAATAGPSMMRLGAAEESERRPSQGTWAGK